ncbi:MAG: ammonia-forming cytochrome c nitrite reductase subunit c552 [Gemmataceae bacterium]
MDTTTPASTAPAPRPSRWLYFATLALLMIVVGLVTALLLNIQQRKNEAKEHVFQIVQLDETVEDPAEWGKNYPRQYDGYKRTVDVVRTKHGGSEAFDKLEQDPLLKRIYAGYAFSIDFREERGHAYMLKDQEETKRVKERKQPGACLHCHASVTNAYKSEGDGDVMKGFEKMCGMDWHDARAKVKHPVVCLDCHDPKSAQIRVTRPAFLVAIKGLAESKDPLPHMPSVERWRKGDRKTPYDPNKEATRQEMRSFVCGQCHVEYYFKPDTKVLTYPWAKGLKIDQIEEYYDEIKFTDWKHADSGAGVLKAQHPEFEMWSQGIHARSGVSCSDCHMPYVREGAIKISDHHVRSPMLNIARACRTCHPYSDQEILSRVETIQDRTKALLNRAERAMVDLIDDIASAKKKGIPEEKIAAAQKLQRRSQFRVDFVSAENSLGFHASQEAARILGEAIDFARQGQVELRKE